jgi:hypothetical protein
MLGSVVYFLKLLVQPDLDQRLIGNRVVGFRFGKVALKDFEWSK